MPRPAMSLTAILTAGALAAPVEAEERGADGTLRMLYWQAPTTLNPYLSGGIKDNEAASLILEPLARYGPDATLRPWLAREIPTLENGGVSADLTRITWRLRDGLTWSDGTPVTSRDVRFTWEYCTAPGTGCAQADKFRDVIAVETPDDATATVVFAAPRPYPYGPFVGPQAPILQEAQFADCLGPAAPTCTTANFGPIGTGPYMAAEFRPGDAVRYVANPGYRAADKPAFSDILLKGGGSAIDAARSVLETGEFDYAWNLQLSPDILTRMADAGRGTVVSAFGALVERIAVNFSDPDPALGTARSTTAHPHPAMGDPSVRRALGLAIDRGLLTDLGYGPAGQPTCSLLPTTGGPTDACVTQNLDGARALLDDAGWRDSDGDGVRDKGGTALSFVFQTSTNAVRQDFQIVLKDWWRRIGIATELRNIEASVFFGGDPGSPDTMQKFHADLQMFAGAFDGADPESYLAGWTCDRIPAPANQWQGANVSRWCDPAYDAMAEALSTTAGTDARAALARDMAQMLVDEGVVIPLVNRGRVSAHVHSLAGVEMNAWDSELWNIADWHRAPAE